MGEHKLPRNYFANGFVAPVDVTFDHREVRRRFEKYLGAGWIVGNLGPSGIVMRQQRSGYSVIVTEAEIDGNEWVHASIANKNHMPSYLDLKTLHEAAYGDRYAYQLFMPQEKHYSFHEFALHLWGRSDGQPCTPDFIAELGTI